MSFHLDPGMLPPSRSITFHTDQSNVLSIANFESNNVLSRIRLIEHRAVDISRSIGIFRHQIEASFHGAPLDACIEHEDRRGDRKRLKPAERASHTSCTLPFLIPPTRQNAGIDYVAQPIYRRTCVLLDIGECVGKMQSTGRLYVA